MSYDYLQHHGVKGMKWGVRHKRKDVGSSNKTLQGHPQGEARNKKPSSKHVKIAAAIAATLAVSYTGVKFATNPHARAVVRKVLDEVGNQKISDLDPFAGYTFVGKDGSPLSPSSIKRLQDLGVL